MYGYGRPMMGPGMGMGPHHMGMMGPGMMPPHHMGMMGPGMRPCGMGMGLMGPRYY